MTAMNGTPRGDGSNDPGASALTLTHAEPVALRVGDDERNAAAAALGEHLTAGRIDLNEYGQRSAQAFAATPKWTCKNYSATCRHRTRWQLDRQPIRQAKTQRLAQPRSGRRRGCCRPLMRSARSQNDSPL